MICLIHLVIKMIKIKELKVKNFKSLINTHITDFGLVNMFYGFNNSGKSNVFRFLNILFAKKKELEIIKVKESESPLSKKATERLVNTADFWEGNIYDQPYLFSNNDRTKDITFEVKLDISNTELPELELLRQNGFIADGDFTELVLKGDITEKNSKDSYLTVTSASLNGKNFHLIEDKITYGFKAEQNDDLDKVLSHEILRMLNDCVEFIDTDRNFTQELFNDDISGFSHKNFKNWLFDLNMNSEKNDTFLELAKFLAGFEFSDDGKEKLASNINSFPFREFTDIGFTRFDNEIEIMLKNNHNRLPLSSFGTGIQQFFYILTRIFMNKSKIIIIEEVELNLSPLYQKELMLFLRSLLGDRYSQLLFSSHSPFFTLKNSELVNVVQHVQIDNSAYPGTKVESHDEWEYFEDMNESIFSMCWS